MQQSLHNEYSGNFQSEGDQWIGSRIETAGGNVNFNSPQYIRNVTYHNAQVHFGDNVGVTINAKVAARTDFEGQYAHNALSPVPTYTQRAKLHQQIKVQLHDRITHVGPTSQILVVHGIGGAGKTQLVLNYIREFREDYSAVFWIEARSKESVERDYIQICSLLYNFYNDAGQAVRLEDAVPAVKRWFYRHKRRWLFVFDSADSISDKEDDAYIDLRSFLPDDPSIHVIITTRDGAAQEMSDLKPVEVKGMEKEEAVTLFKKHAKMSSATPQEDAEMLSIVQELGYLALAILLAGSYVSTTPRLKSDITKYGPEYKQRRKELLSQQPKWLVHQYGESVLTTWETTFDAMEKQCPGACRLLSVLAFLHGDDIFMDFPALIGSDEISDSERTIDQYDFERFFTVLRNFSFVSFRDDQQSYSVHKLVHVWAYDRLGPEEKSIYGHGAMLLLEKLIKSVQAAEPLVKERLIPHIVVSFTKLQCFEFLTLRDDPILRYFKLSSSFLDSCGRWNDAVGIQRFILNKYRSMHGEKHPATILAMSDLASTLGEIGELQEALSLKREVLGYVKRIKGEEHPDTISAMNNLAITLSGVGQIKQALSLQREVLDKTRRIQGEVDPHTISAIGNLAITLGEVGELQESLSLQREALVKSKRMLGEEHTKTISMINNLAAALWENGQRQQALLLQQEAVEKRRRILGKGHPQTMSAEQSLQRMQNVINAPLPHGEP